MNLSTLLAGVISGLLLGGLYAIAALGLSLVFGVMRLVNIVHGEFLLLAAYLNFSLASALGLDPLLAVLLIAPVMFLIGYVIQRIIGRLSVACLGDAREQHWIDNHLLDFFAQCLSRIV